MEDMNVHCPVPDFAILARRYRGLIVTLNHNWPRQFPACLA
jgi:hypothetical protein